MAIYKDKTDIDNRENRWSEPVLVCPECDTEHRNPSNGRTRCKECGAHGLVPAFTTICGVCFGRFIFDDYVTHKQECEL